MLKIAPLPTAPKRFGQRPVRAWRPWFWGLALWLRLGGGAVAFYLAARSGWAGALAFAAFGVGWLLREILEATSQGD